jgi:hypothetical protein
MVKFSGVLAHVPLYRATVPAVGNGEMPAIFGVEDPLTNGIGRIKTNITVKTPTLLHFAILTAWSLSNKKWVVFPYLITR